MKDNGNGMTALQETLKVLRDEGQLVKGALIILRPNGKIECSWTGMGPLEICGFAQILNNAGINLMQSDKPEVKYNGD